MRAGYRLFADDDIAVLRFIRQAKTLGLTLAEINDIHSLQRGGAQPCGRVTPLLDTHIDRTLAELRQLRRASPSPEFARSVSDNRWPRVPHSSLRGHAT